MPAQAIEQPKPFYSGSIVDAGIVDQPMAQQSPLPSALEDRLPQEINERPCMTVYVIAQLRFIDRSAYERYQSNMMSVLRQFSGRLLAADEHGMVLEGECRHDKVVVLSFSDAEMFRAWSKSREYQVNLAARKSGANAVVLLVRGVS